MAQALESFKVKESPANGTSILHFLVRATTRVFFCIGVAGFVGIMVRTMQRSLGRPILTGSYGFPSQIAAGVSESAHQGLAEGLFFGGILSCAILVITLVLTALGKDAKGLALRLPGFVLGALVGFLVSGAKECSESFSGGPSTFSWRLFNHETDAIIFSLVGGILGLMIGAALQSFCHNANQSRQPLAID